MFVWDEELNIFREADDDTSSDDSGLDDAPADDSSNTSDSDTSSDDNTDEENTDNNNKDDNSEDDNSKEDSTDDSENTDDSDDGFDTGDSPDDTSEEDPSMDDTENSDDAPLDEDPQESYERYSYYQKFEKMLQCISSLENKIENIKQNNNEEVQLLKTFVIKLKDDINYIQTDKITSIGVENLSKLYLVLVSKLEIMTDMTESYFNLKNKKSETEK